MKVVVLLSTYNGEKYLKDQLNSLVQQDLKPTKILIRDDGSNDSTISILKEYSSKYSIIEYYQGMNIGPAKSFFELINKCHDCDYYALCDQDDVWHEDKLSSAINMLEKEDSNIPLLYASRFTLTDEKLKPLDSNMSKLYSYTDFAHSLIYHTAPGCTFVFNDKSREQIIKYDVNSKFCVIHDEIVHKVVTMFGKMILDETSHIYYRQHSKNVYGLTANKNKEFIHRISNFLSKKVKNNRSNIAKALLGVYGNNCSKENKHLLEIVANYKNDSCLKRELIENNIFKTGTINDLFFYLLVLFNYI